MTLFSMEMQWPSSFIEGFLIEFSSVGEQAEKKTDVYAPQVLFSLWGTVSEVAHNSGARYID